MFAKSKSRIRREEQYPSAAAVANAFMRLAARDGKTLDNLQLQKLVYIAYGFAQGVWGKPLFHDDIEAWPLGPVIPSLYHELKKYGWHNVTAPIATSSSIDESDPSWGIIEAVWDSYGKFTGEELSALTHQDDTPWSSVYKPGLRGLKIPDEVIRNHYRQKIARND